MTCKLHINLSLGLIEVEGSEKLVRDIYADFQKNLTSHKGLDAKSSEIEEKGSRSPKGKSKADDKPKTTKKSNTSGELLAVVKEFYNGLESKKFLDEIAKYVMPKGHQKMVTLFIYIMHKIKIKNISLNHLYTCYKLLTIPSPANIRAILGNVRTRRAWLILDDFNDIKLHHKGEEFVELEIPKSK